MGYQLLRWIVGDRALALITQRPGCTVPDSSPVGFPGVVPDLGKCAHFGCGFGSVEKRGFNWSRSLDCPKDTARRTFTVTVDRVTDESNHRHLVVELLSIHTVRGR